jgi:hypothetical protein
MGLQQVWAERMMRSVGIAVIVLLAAAPAMARNVMAFGIGHETCAVWLSTPRRVAEGKTWIAGYWSAANLLTMGDHEIGRNTDVNGIAEAVKAVCLAQRSQLLIEATTKAYAQFPED